jgi:hypothetical protein
MSWSERYPCHPLAYYTTRPILLKLGIPLYWRGLYIPHIPLFPLCLIWACIGVIVLVFFGGIAIILGKEDSLRRWWFK